MLELLKRRILFVGGKGGVGKTTAAAALAVSAAKRGKRCLLVSTDPAHSLGDLFGPTIGDPETEIMPGLRALEIDPDAAAEQYIASVRQSMRDLVRPALYAAIDRQMDLARLAPGTTESAMLQRMTDLMLDAPANYELLIFDTAPTGHTLQLLALPEVMASWTGGLLNHQQRSENLARVVESLETHRPPRNTDELSYLSEAPDSIRYRNLRIREILKQRCLKFRQARELLLDNHQCAFILVLIPEKLPILESKKTVANLHKHKIQVAALLINRLLPADITGAFMQDRQQQEARYLQEIEADFKSIQRYYLPLLRQDVHGKETLEKIGDLLISASP